MYAHSSKVVHGRLETDEGPVVVADAESLGPDFDRQLSFLTPDERKQRILDCPSRLFDTESQILTLFPDES